MNMNIKLKDAEIKVEIVRLDSEMEQLRNSASVLYDILTTGNGDTFEGHQCIQCNKTYKSASTLRMHIMFKHPANQSQAYCELCKKYYSSRMSLQKHYQYMHRVTFYIDT
uniref:C2H2-type domain-containing protein n=1 Tax=Bombyx mori TaxID=7091 RepID=A0A8R2QUV4_BOMMO|nr:broad-complex core protein isoforms 1/2/3/4/5-like [Bombyx mori]